MMDSFSKLMQRNHVVFYAFFFLVKPCTYITQDATADSSDRDASAPTNADSIKNNLYSSTHQDL